MSEPGAVARRLLRASDRPPPRGESFLVHDFRPEPVAGRFSPHLSLVSRLLALALLWVVSAASAQSAKQEQAYEVKPSVQPCLNFRQFPNTGAPIVDCLAAKTPLTKVYAITGWIKGRTEDGVEGWLAEAFVRPVREASLQPAPPPPPPFTDLPPEVEGFSSDGEEPGVYRIGTRAAPCLKLRRSPVSGQPIDCLPPGTRIEVLESREGWFRAVVDDGREGWVSASYLEPEVVVEAATGAAAPDPLRVLPPPPSPVAPPIPPVTETVIDPLPSAAGPPEEPADDGALLTEERIARDLEEPPPTILAERLPSTPEPVPTPAENETIVELRDELGDVTRERDLLAANLRRTKAALEQAERQAAAGQESVARQERDLSQELSILKESLSASRAEADGYRGEVERLEGEIEGLRAATTAGAEESALRIAALEADLRTVRGIAEESARTEAQLRARVAELEEAAEEARLRAAAAEQALAESRLAAPAEPLPAEPLPAEPLPLPEPQGPDIEEAIATVLSWAEAWSQQRVGDYLAFYSRDFQPEGHDSLAAWQAHRRDRIESPAHIDLSVSAVQATFVDPQRVSVRFRQAYRSPTYEDVVLKILILGWEGESWKILQETVEEVLDGS